MSGKDEQPEQRSRDAAHRAGRDDRSPLRRSRGNRNLAANPHVVLTTGANALRGGLDLVVEGRAERMTDPDRLQALADAWEKKYGSEWHFELRDGGFGGGNGLALVYRIEPATAFCFGKAPYSQTRWRFPGA